MGRGGEVRWEGGGVGRRWGGRRGEVGRMLGMWEVGRVWGGRRWHGNAYLDLPATYNPHPHFTQYTTLIHSCRLHT